MGDFLNLNITDLGLDVESVNDLQPDRDTFTTRLVEGVPLLARIEEVTEKFTPNSIGLNVAVSVMVNPEAERFDPNATIEKLNYNFIWIGDNTGTVENPVLSLRDGKPSGFLISFIGGVGVQNLLKDGKVDFTRAVGLIVQITVKHEKYEGNLNSKIKRWLGCVDNSAVANHDVPHVVANF